MKLEVLNALSPHVAIIVDMRWESPCVAMFNCLAKHHPQDLLNLIKANVLANSDLTFAAEMAGEIADSFAVQTTLHPLLDHKDAVVREGAIYGLSRHFASLGGTVLLKLKALAKFDPSLGVRAAAQELFT